MSRPLYDGPGPFRTSQLAEGDPYELWNGHTLRLLPASPVRTWARSVGFRVIATDPIVEDVRIRTGIAWNDDKNLRTLDLVVGGGKPVPGWQRTFPPLAVEYADNGQDEAELQLKISELLAGGTQYIWVVRLVGPLRVEVHTRDKPMRMHGPGEELAAPGVLKNPVPVLALVETAAADSATLRNLLDKYGYASVEEIEQTKFEEGRAAGVAESILEMFDERGLAVSEGQAAKIRGCRDLKILRRWLRRAATAESVAAAID